MSFEDVSRRANADFNSLFATQRSLAARVRALSLSSSIPVRMMKIVTVVLGATSMTATYVLWRSADTEADIKRNALRSLHESISRHDALLESAKRTVRIDGAVIQTALAGTEDNAIRQCAEDAIRNAEKTLQRVDERRLRRGAVVSAL